MIVQSLRRFNPDSDEGLTHISAGETEQGLTSCIVRLEKALHPISVTEELTHISFTPTGFNEFVSNSSLFGLIKTTTPECDTETPKNEVVYPNNLANIGAVCLWREHTGPKRDQKL